MVFKEDFKLMKAALVGTIFAVAGWLGVSALFDIFDFDSVSPYVRLVASVVVVYLGFKLGIRK